MSASRREREARKIGLECSSEPCGCHYEACPCEDIGCPTFGAQFMMCKPHDVEWRNTAKAIAARARKAK